MKNIFLIAIGFAMCGTVAATPDCSVIAKSEVVVDAGIEQVAVAVTPAVAIEYAYIASPMEYTICAKSIGSGFEWTDTAISACGINWGESAAVLPDPGRQRGHDGSGNDSATFINYDEAINRLSTNLSFRKARDGLRC